MTLRFGRSRLCFAAVLALSGSVGCLDDAPTFAPRGQIPPFIVASQVDPPLSSIYEGPIPFTINVPFRSEDVNQDLAAQLYLDLVPGADTRGPVEKAVVSAGVFEDTSRSVTLDWVEALDRCHSLTLILTYAENIDDTGFPRDDSRAARVVWWLDVGDVDGDTPISSCPRPNALIPESVPR